MMKRITLDGMLLLLILLLMSFSFLPGELHELLGILLALAIILHLSWNRAWFTSLHKGKWTVWRGISSMVDLLLLFNVAAILATGISISTFLFPDLVSVSPQQSMTFQEHHTSLPYLFLLLVGVHLGFHWQMLWQRFMKWTGWDRSSRAYPVLCWLIAFAIAGLGVYSSIVNHMGEHLMMKPVFDMAILEQSLPTHLALIIGIVGLYAFLGFFLRKVLLRR